MSSEVDSSLLRSQLCRMISRYLSLQSLSLSFASQPFPTGSGCSSSEYNMSARGANRARIYALSPCVAGTRERENEGAVPVREILEYLWPRVNCCLNIQSFSSRSSLLCANGVLPFSSSLFSFPSKG